MLFSQRKEIHKMYAEYLKVNPLPSYTWINSPDNKE